MMMDWDGNKACYPHLENGLGYPRCYAVFAEIRQYLLK